MRARLGDAGTTGELLREMRKRRSLTQPQLAALVGLDQSYISKLEAGARSVRMPLLRKVASACGYTVSVVCTHENGEQLTAEEIR